LGYDFQESLTLCTEPVLFALHLDKGTQRVRGDSAISSPQPDWMPWNPKLMCSNCSWVRFSLPWTCPRVR